MQERIYSQWPKMISWYHIFHVIIVYRGLGLDQLIIKFLELYSDPKVLVLVLNTKSTEEVLISNVDVV